MQYLNADTEENLYKSHKVLNISTGRYIKIDATTYKRLIKEGYTHISYLITNNKTIVDEIMEAMAKQEMEELHNQMDEIAKQEAIEIAKQEAIEIAKQEAIEIAKQEAIEIAKQEAIEIAKQEAIEVAKQEAIEIAKKRDTDEEENEPVTALTEKVIIIDDDDDEFNHKHVQTLGSYKIDISEYSRYINALPTQMIKAFARQFYTCYGLKRHCLGDIDSFMLWFEEYVDKRRCPPRSWQHELECLVRTISAHSFANNRDITIVYKSGKPYPNESDRRLLKEFFKCKPAEKYFAAHHK